MSAEKSISRIHLNDEDVFLIAESKSDFNLFLKILNIKEKKAYVGQASSMELRSQAASIRLSFTDFIQKATEALFQNSTKGSNFLYCLDKKGEAYIFKWKSIDSEETIINLGSVEMVKREFDILLTDILLSLAEEVQSLKTNQQSLSKELSTSKSQLSNALNKLSAADSLKENVEKDLYSKFILVLNEKKRKIKELEKNTKTTSCSFKNNASNRKSAKVPISSSESEEVDGDVDIHCAGPSNAPKRNSLLFYEETKSIPQSTIRNRKAATNKKSNNILEHVSAPSKCDNHDEDSGSADSLMEFL